MSGFEGARTLEGAPGLEGGKRPVHTTAPCIVAEHGVDMLENYLQKFPKTFVLRDQNRFSCFGQSEGQEGKAVHDALQQLQHCKVQNLCV